MADDVVMLAAASDLAVPGAGPVVPAAPPPISMAEAASRKAEFLADKTKTAALMNGDVNATAEWKLITDNLYQAPQVTAPRDEVTNHLQESAGGTLPEAVLAEYRENRPVSPAEYRMARTRFDSRLQDKEWIAKLNRGDLDTKKELVLVQSILSRPIRDVPTT